MRRTHALITAAFSVTALILAGCAQNSAGQPAAPASGAATFPVTVGKITLDNRPERIVSLSPTATEMLFAIGAGGQVTAVDEDSNYPPQAPTTKLSGVQPNAEAIAAKNPDLVVISNDINKIAEQLTRLKIPVFQAPAAGTLDDSYAQIRDLGALTGNAAAAADLTRRMKDEIAKLVSDVPHRTTPLTYYYELDPTYYSVTSKTFVGSIFAMMGLRSVADAADSGGSANGYPQLSEETLVKADPDLIFLADTRCCQQSATTVRARPGWSHITAVRTGRIVLLDDDIASRWGPRTVDLVRAIADAVERVPS